MCVLSLVMVSINTFSVCTDSGGKKALLECFWPKVCLCVCVCGQFSFCVICHYGV